MNIRLIYRPQYFSYKPNLSSVNLVLGGADDAKRNYPALLADRCAALSDTASTRKKRPVNTWPRNRACSVAGQQGTIATSGDVGTPESPDAGLSGV